MQTSLLRELRSRRDSIRARWDALVRAEPVVTPLALPEALTHLIDTTLDEIFREFEAVASPQHDASNRTAPACACGRNPFLAYFLAAQQAMHEGLVLAQAALSPLDPHDRDASLAELEAVLARISRRDIEAFCGVCQFRRPALPSAPQLLEIGRP